MPGPITIDLLYFDGCPHYAQAQRLLTDTIGEMNLDARVRLVNVESQAQADALHFAGSPSIIIDGRDLEDYDGPGVLACRLYGTSGSPSHQLLRARLLAAHSSNHSPAGPAGTEVSHVS